MKGPRVNEQCASQSLEGSADAAASSPEAKDPGASGGGTASRGEVPATSEARKPATQKTVAAPVRLEGIGLHLGERVAVEILPAPPNSGIVFVRSDLPGRPRVNATLENLKSHPRRTALASGSAEVHTIEHLMATLWALGIQNAEIAIDGVELPGLDGSARPYYEALQEAGVRDQDEPARTLALGRTVGVSSPDASIVALPCDGGFRVSYTLDYGPTTAATQFLSLIVDQESFGREIAPARTFCLEEEAMRLRAAGLGKGANTENTLVVAMDGSVIDNDLRFENEFVRHKILDLIGDLYLTNCRIEAHVLATKSGHSLNVELARQLLDKGANAGGADAKIADAKVSGGERAARSDGSSSKAAEARSEPYQRTASGAIWGYRGPLSSVEIRDILPHRYPFVLIDRVVEVAADGSYARGVKNCTCGEPYFNGHFPDDPVMPGVLQLEAMAQIGGVLLHSHERYAGKRAYLVSLENVKFRKRIVPGDQLVLEAHALTLKDRAARLRARVSVDGSLAAEAQINYVLAS